MNQFINLYLNDTEFFIFINLMILLLIVSLLGLIFNCIYINYYNRNAYE